MKDLKLAVQLAKTMIEVEGIIFTEVSNKWMKLFAVTERKFNIENETQEKFINDLNEKYGTQAMEDRIELIKLIPEKLHKTEMYKKLISKVKS